MLSSRLLRKNRPLLLDIPLLLKQSGLRYSGYQGLITQGAFLNGPTVGKLCRDNQLPVWQTRDINDAEGIAFLTEKSSDYLLTVNFNQKLSAEVLALPSRGCINLHPSLLPDYKGVDPILAALAEGECHYGITLHRMDEDFDTGAILDQRTLSVVTDQCLFWHYVQAFQQGAKMAKSFLEAAGQGYSEQQQQQEGRYFGWPTRRQVKGVRKLIKMSNFLKRPD